MWSSTSWAVSPPRHGPGSWRGSGRSGSSTSSRARPRPSPPAPHEPLTDIGAHPRTVSRQSASTMPWRSTRPPRGSGLGRGSLAGCAVPQPVQAPGRPRIDTTDRYRRPAMALAATPTPRSPAGSAPWRSASCSSATGVAMIITGEIGVAPYDVLTTGIAEPPASRSASPPCSCRSASRCSDGLLGRAPGPGTLLAVLLVGPILGAGARRPAGTTSRWHPA